MKELDTLNWLTYLCDADLRHSSGFRHATSELSLETAIELYVDFLMRKATRHGG